MKVVIQRVSKAAVAVNGKTISSITRGIMALVCIEKGDSPADLQLVARKISGLRIFPTVVENADNSGETKVKPMDQSLVEIGGHCLAVSQFTLAGDIRKGRRPGFDRAEEPQRAEAMFEEFCQMMRSAGVPTQTGQFGANMQVELVNDGPVTFVVQAQNGVLLN